MLNQQKGDGEFQFLIGKLLTNKIGMWKRITFYMFQFLIGKLLTKAIEIAFVTQDYGFNSL